MTETVSAPLWKRLAWFVFLWAVGVFTVGATAELLHWWLR